MKFGYFKHWFRPPYSFAEFLADEGYDIEEIDFSLPGYLDKYDVAIVEQNGFNDYIENDEPYIAEWVKKGGILLFMHQDYQRWAPYFIPAETGYTQLIHRHVPTVRVNKNSPISYCYMMPWIEEKGKALFNIPEKITADEMIGWNVTCNTFRITTPEKGHDPTETLGTAAQSCFLVQGSWEILGSYMDPAVKDGALILQAKYGKGLYFITQLLFPEVKPAEGDRCTAFWKKYMRNLEAYFQRFKSGTPEPVIHVQNKYEVMKKNYKLCIHMHSLDWFGCDSAPGTINAMMRYMGFDICALAVKDTGPYDGKLDPAKFTDDKVLFLDGQEYHPFNWKDKYDAMNHNSYHMLPIGIDPDAYTGEFTRSLYGDEQVDSYLKRAIAYVHEKHGAVCATHPNKADYWRNYDFDAVDQEPLVPLAGSHIEKHWLSGKRIAVMDSVDLFGFQRILNNPAVNFVYLQGEKPCRDSVVKAIKNHHTIAAANFDEADVMLNDHIPGEVIPKAETASAVIKVSAKAATGTIREVRVYADDKVIAKADPGTASVDLEFTLKNPGAEKFIRVEAEGEKPEIVMISTPFFLK
ncbi:MAG: hypothetical protein IKC65_09450 [Lentisphaeria bacterium]|nr:hypothetical protein [Lentisphaeria bacterium]